MVAAVAVMPAAALVLLAFRSGGYLPAAAATAAVGALATCILVALVGRPHALRPGAIVALAALAALIGWTVLSGTWSHAGWRALLDASRDLAYLGTLGAFVLLGRTDRRARVLLLGLAGAALLVDVVALSSWLVPDHVHPPSAERLRLSAPLSYWNATGLVAGMGVVWSLGLSAADPSRIVRIAASVGAPLGAATIYFTASRGAAAAAVVGVLVLLATGPTRRVALALVSAAAPVALALLAAHGAHGLDRAVPGASALSAGRHAAVLICAAAVLAAVLCAALAPAHRRVEAWRPGPRLRSRVRIGAAAMTAVLVLGALAAGGTSKLADGVRDVTSARNVASDLPPAQRFRQVSTNGRTDLWRVAVRHGFRAEPLRGSGAGSFARLWALDGTTHFHAVDAHSLYAEKLGELGLVGGVLIAVLLAVLLAALLRRSRERGAGTAAWAALTGGAVAWTVHAGIDFDWELPALTLPVLAAGGLALAAPDRGTAERSRSLPVAARVAVAVVALGLMALPVLVHRSQTSVDAALRAFRDGDCATAQREARRARGALPSRPAPYEVLAWCAVRGRQAQEALAFSAAAVRRDPGDWELRLSDAIVHARLGRDPRPGFAAALARRPAALELEHARSALGTAHSAAGWRRLGAAVPLPQPRLAGQQLPATAG